MGKFSDEDLLRFLCEEAKKSETRRLKKGVKMEEENKVVSVKNPHNRYIPVQLKNRLFQKGEHQCQFISPLNGQRCLEKNRLQVHHLFPFSMGGPTIEFGFFMAEPS